MLCHLMVYRVDLLVIPVVDVDDCGFAVIRHKDTGSAAKVFIHVNVGGNPGLLFLVEESFHVRILAVGHDAYKQPCLGNFAGIRVNDLCRVSGPVYFNLLTGLAVDVHGGAAFLLILLDVITEL